MSEFQTLSSLKKRGKRIALFGAILETYDTPVERKGFIMAMWGQGLISSLAAEMLIEVYGLENA